MNKTSTNAIAPAAGRGTVTRLTDAQRPSLSRIGSVSRGIDSVSRARDARRSLRPRSERFAHLKRMYD